MTALVMYLTGIGSVMGFVLTSDQVAVHLAHGIATVTQDKWVVLALVTLSLLVLGCFLETVPALLIGVPLFGPLVTSFGIDPLHFGVVLTFALLLGIIHPPVGLGLFTVCAISPAAAGSGGARQPDVLSRAAAGAAAVHVRAGAVHLVAESAVCAIVLHAGLSQSLMGTP